MRGIIAFTTVIFLLAGCSNNGPSPSAEWDPSGCDCQEYIYAGAGDLQKDSICDARMSIKEFKAEFVKCNYAAMLGKDTSEVDMPTQAKADVQTPSDGTYAINVETSKVLWKGKKSLVESEHGGIMRFTEGNELVVTNGMVSSGSLVVDMATIECTDHFMDDEGKTNLAGHLMAPDFFDVAQHPTATFTITSVEGEFPKVKILGDLTIKGITLPATADFNLANSGANGMIAAGTLIFDRSKFDVRYGSGSFFDDLGDEIIDDDIVLTIGLKAELK